MNLFKKKEIFKVTSEEVDPESMAEPTTEPQYVERGMVFYARKRYAEAEKDLRAAIGLDPKSIDAYYSLGMVLKAQQKADEAVNAFQHAIDLLKASAGDANPRIEMLRRLALGHINEITQGDWNLEKEIWRRIQ
jgi:tetratricopeptide (TPR) repeat protein